MGRMRRGRIAGLVLGLVVSALAGAIAYLRFDKKHVFFDVRGEYGRAATLDAWSSSQSKTRLIRLRNRDGEVVTDAFLRRPLQLDPTYRIVVIYAGAKTRDRILTLVPEQADLVLVSVQYPYRSPETPGEYLRWPGAIRAAAFRTVAGGMLALDFLRADEGLDLRRVTVVGVSVGVPFATMHGALDERVPTVMLIHGGGDLAAQVRATHEPRWLAVPAGMLASVLFYSFEPLRYVDRIAPRRLVMVAARGETMLPAGTVEALYAKAREPKKLIWTESDHVRSRDTDVVAQIIEQIDRYLASGGSVP